VNRIWTAGSAGRPSTVKKSTRQPSFSMSTDPIAGVPDLQLSFFGSRPSLFLKGLDVDVDDRWSGDEVEDQSLSSPVLEANRPSRRIPDSLHSDLPEAFSGECIFRPQAVHPPEAPMQPHGKGSWSNAQSQQGIFVSYSCLPFS